MKDGKTTFIWWKYPLFLAFCLVCSIAGAQTRYAAWDLPTIVSGNHKLEDGLGIGNDFEVLAPVTVWAVGVFDDHGDGIQGTAVLKVHLYASNPDRARKRSSGVLLETVLFDAANPGELRGGFRYKPLVRPVTLIPGQYTITADGFDERNLDFRKWNDPSSLRVALNGAGLVRFTGCNHYHIGHFLQRTRTAQSVAAPERAPDRYAAATFVFSAAPQYASPFATDYAALTAGVRSFPWNTNKSKIFSYRYGSLAVLDDNAFPVIVEPSGSRIIFEAAGIQPTGARCIAFADEQWADSRVPDARALLFENAIRWTSRKAAPSQIVIGLSTNLPVRYFRQRGFKVVPLDGDMNPTDRGSLFDCDVLLMDLRPEYSQQSFELAAAFIAEGGSLVAAGPPTGRLISANLASPISDAINQLLRPFGLVFRSTAAQVYDLGLTNVQAAAYPPSLFNAFPAAGLLRRDRVGQTYLTSLEKMLALNTMSYAADGRPDLLTSLASVYSGARNGVPGTSTSSEGVFSEIATISGAMANSNFLGRWRRDGTDLVSVDTRGSAEYDFQVVRPGVSRIKIFGQENPPRGRSDILISVDGVALGQYGFQVPLGADTLLSLFASQLGQGNPGTAYQTNDHVECLTQFLTPGPHTLRIFWNNPTSFTELRLSRIQIESAAGEDTDGDGAPDWEQAFIDSESGLDETNETLSSLTSPMCVEGRDPFPDCMELRVIGADGSAPNIAPMSAPNGRWYANVPLAERNDASLQISFQHGAKLDTRRLRWLPVNVLNGGKLTIRGGDSLLLTARPETATGISSGTVLFTIGTNQFTRDMSTPLRYTFSGAGTQTISAVYTAADGIAQTGTLSVQVVQHSFTNSPACHAGEERDWQFSLPSEAIFETDQRLLVSQMLEGETRIALTIDQSESRYFLSRLGADGPVLASGAARGFDYWAGGETGLRGLKRFADGSELVEMMLVLNPVLPDVTVKIDVFVGGVTFDDGTNTKELTHADFDALGRAFVRFLHPPDFKPAVCHTVTIFQGGAVIGHIW